MDGPQRALSDTSNPAPAAHSRSVISEAQPTGVRIPSTQPINPRQAKFFFRSELLRSISAAPFVHPAAQQP